MRCMSPDGFTKRGICFEVAHLDHPDSGMWYKCECAGGWEGPDCLVQARTTTMTTTTKSTTTYKTFPNHFRTTSQSAGLRPTLQPRFVSPATTTIGARPAAVTTSTQTNHLAEEVTGSPKDGDSKAVDGSKVTKQTAIEYLFGGFVGVCVLGYLLVLVGAQVAKTFKRGSSSEKHKSRKKHRSSASSAHSSSDEEQQHAWASKDQTYLPLGVAAAYDDVPLLGTNLSGGAIGDFLNLHRLHGGAAQYANAMFDFTSAASTSTSSNFFPTVATSAGSSESNSFYDASSSPPHGHIDSGSSSGVGSTPDHCSNGIGETAGQWQQEPRASPHSSVRIRHPVQSCALDGIDACWLCCIPGLKCQLA
jgi:hypothetical protein